MAELRRGDLIEWPSASSPTGWEKGEIEKIHADGRIEVKNAQIAGAKWLLTADTKYRRISLRGDAPSGLTVATKLQPDPPQAMARIASASGQPVLPSPVMDPQDKSGMQES